MEIDYRQYIFIAFVGQFHKRNCINDLITFIPIDIDECKLGTHDCHTNADCINKPGTFVCRCKYGFFGDGYNCTCKFIQKEI